MTRLPHPARLPNPAIWLLAALGLLFLLTPFVEALPRGDIVESALLSLVMIFGVLALEARGRSRVVAFLLALPALAAKWVNHVRPGLCPPLVFLSLSTAFFVLVVVLLLRRLLHASRVDTNALCAGLSGYLILGLLWVPVYLLVSQLDAHAFMLGPGTEPGATMDGFRAFYFSFITLCTVGYGDVVPVSRVARMCAIIEAIAGLFYVAVFISRLVAIYSMSAPGNATPRGPQQERPGGTLPGPEVEAQ